MQINQETDYALRVILFLSRLGPDTRVEARIISEKENIPIRFLLKLLRKLIQEQLVKSYRGVNGGYSINKLPQNISLRDVIEAIEGPVYVNRCIYNPLLCTNKGTATCSIHSALTKVQKQLLDGLEGINFQDIMDGKI